MRVEDAHAMALMLRTVAADIEDGTLVLGHHEGIRKGGLTASVDTPQVGTLVVTIHIEGPEPERPPAEVRQELSHPGG